MKKIIIENLRIPSHLYIKKTNNSYSLFSKIVIKKDEIVFINYIMMIDNDTEISSIIDDESFTFNKNHFIAREQYNEFVYFDSFINHSCDPNTSQSYVDIDVYKMTALKDIEPDTELTMDYTIGYYQNFTKVDYLKHISFQCNCKSKNCKIFIQA